MISTLAIDVLYRYCVSLWRSALLCMYDCQHCSLSNYEVCTYISFLVVADGDV